MFAAQLVKSLHRITQRPDTTTRCVGAVEAWLMFNARTLQNAGRLDACSALVDMARELDTGSTQHLTDTVWVGDGDGGLMPACTDGCTWITTGAHIAGCTAAKT